MLTRLCCVFFFLASPAAAELITISEGYHERVNITDDRELLMTGGTIEFLNAAGGLSTIEGGRVIEARGIRNAEIVVTGSDGPISIYSEREGSTVLIHGYHLRIYSYSSGSQHSSHRIEGYLLDGTYTGIHLSRTGTQSLHHFEIIKHDPIWRDPDRDWDFDLEDLNLIRNSFGESNSEIDTNFDGVIDLSDLNLVRNQFGGGAFSGLPPESEFSGVIPPFGQSSVPEPSSLLLAFLFITASLTKTVCK